MPAVTGNPDIRLEVRPTERTDVLRLVGELDSRSVQHVREKTAAAGSGLSELTLELSEVTFIDSSQSVSRIVELTGLSAHLGLD